MPVIDGAGPRPAIGEPRYRLPLVLFFVFLGLVGQAGRLIQIQGIDADKLRRQAEAQRTATKSLEPKRGTIYDREGEILATTVDMERVIATPYLVKHPRKLASKLALILGQKPRELYKKLTRKSGFEYIARMVDKKKTSAIRKLEKDDPGITEGLAIEAESKRSYPGGALASQIIGFINYEGVAASGLELAYSRQLAGKPGRLSMERSGDGRPMPNGKYELKPAVDGSQLMLTLDQEVQFKAEQVLARTVRKFKAKAGTVIVMNPLDGQIYAMASYPTFDLNKFYKSKPEAQLNRAISAAFEPGSTMKVVTVSGALEQGLVSTSTVVGVPPFLSVGGYKIVDSHPHGYLNLSVTDVVARSSNIGVSRIGQKLGKERLYDYITRFGLNRKTGIDLPGETNGWVPLPSAWSASSIGNIPFGQGITATPLEMIRVMSIVANGGRQIRPYLVEKVILPSGKVMNVAPTGVGGRVIRSETAARMRRILEEVVHGPQGTAPQAAIPGYRVAGKTGTATKIKEDGTGYDKGRYIASFAGFVPAQRPELAVLVAIDEPRTTIWGGVVAAPAFREVAEFSLRRLEIEP